MDEYDDDEIDLSQLWRTIKKNIVLFIAICIVTCSLGFFVSKFVLQKKYSATAKIVVVKEENANSSASFTVNDVTMSQKLTATYEEIINSEAVSKEVIKNLDLGERNINLYNFNGLLSVSSIDSTQVMSITATTSEPELSADIANEVVKVAITKIYDIMEVKNIAVLNDARIPEKKSSPSTIKWTAIGGFLGAAICALITIILTLTDTKVKTEEEVKQIFPNYPIIGNIPNVNIKEDDNYDEQEINS